MIFKQKCRNDEKEDLIKNVIHELELLYETNANYTDLGNGYLPGDSELERMINKVLELKNSQIKQQFLANSGLIEFVTHMSYVKDMVYNISSQKKSIENIAVSSEEMSHAIEEIANYVQASLSTTNEAVQISTDSLRTINHSLEFINKSFKEINGVKDKMHQVVEDTKEIDTIVNFINNVAEQTNLLALNASIEAARAGVYGKGFSVVANEIKNLAQNTKESGNYIKSMVNKLRGEIGSSEQVISEAVKVFGEGAEHINDAITSMDRMEEYLGRIGLVFEDISANVEEQTATTEEISTRLKEINSQTQYLNNVCMKTGQGIYDISVMLEENRNNALPWFKDLKGNTPLKLVATEHLLWKWKVYNVVSGFIKLEENDIPDHTKCSIGQYLEKVKETNKSDKFVLKLDEPHKKIHMLTRKVIRIANSENKENIEDYIKELDEVTKEFVTVLYKVNMPRTS